MMDGKEGPRTQGEHGPFFTDVFPGQEEEGGQGHVGYLQVRPGQKLDEGPFRQECRR